MNRHEGVVCDACSKNNFKGRRYRCLVCFDYDLCADCYEKGATSTYHLKDHPMQCILTLSDFELFFGGEYANPVEPAALSYTYEMDLSDAALMDPLPAAGSSRGTQNMVLDHFANQLALEQRGQQELITFLDDLPAIRRGRRVRRRIQHDIHSHRSLPPWSPLGRESIYPIPEILPQVAALRRGATPHPTRLEQLQRDMQMEIQQDTRLPRRFLQTLPTANSFPTPMDTSVSPLSRPLWGGGNTRAFGSGRIDTGITAASGGSVPIRTTGRALNAWNLSQQLQANTTAPNAFNIKEVVLNAPAVSAKNDNGSGNNPTVGANNVAHLKTEDIALPFLLSKYTHPTLDDAERADMERERANRSLFVQSLLLTLDLTSDTHIDMNTGLVNKDKSSTASSQSRAGVSERWPSNVDVSVQTANVGHFETGQQKHQHQQTSPEDFADKFKQSQQPPYLLKKKPPGKSCIPVAGGRGLVRRESLSSPNLGSATATGSQPLQRQPQLYCQTPATKPAPNQIPDAQ